MLDVNIRIYIILQKDDNEYVAYREWNFIPSALHRANSQLRKLRKLYGYKNTKYKDVTHTNEHVKLL